MGGKFHYLDVQGKPIKLEENRAEPTLRMSQSYGSADRLDPGQDATHSIDAEFPAEALADKKLKEVRLELTYIPAPFKAETMSFPVSVGSAQ